MGTLWDLVLQKFSCSQAANSESNYKGKGECSKEKRKSKKETVPVPNSREGLQDTPQGTSKHQLDSTQHNHFPSCQGARWEHVLPLPPPSCKR